MLIMTKPISTRSYLGKISNKMTSKSIILRQYVEEEWVHIVVKGFMVQKQLRKQTQILLQSNKLRHLNSLHQTFSLRRLLQPSSKYYLKLHDNKIREVCYLSSDNGGNTHNLWIESRVHENMFVHTWQYILLFLPSTWNIESFCDLPLPVTSFPLIVGESTKIGGSPCVTGSIIGEVVL